MTMPDPSISRRDALKLTATAAATFMTPSLLAAQPPPTPPTPPAPPAPLFHISLAQWSLHRTIFGGTLDHLDFPKAARRDYGIDAVEYVTQFFKTHDDAAIRELKSRCDDEGVRSLLIMCDGQGNLGDPDEAARLKAVENHRKWVAAAVALGCHSIRVNAQSRGTLDEQERLAADGLRRLCEIGEEHAINIIVENHGGPSSRGDWLAAVMRRVEHPRIGTLPDFGNWQEYDRYLGVKELMPFAKAVSAKSHDFDERGNETGTDYRRMLRIVLDAGYSGHIGIEYEGSTLSEPDGIRATKRLLETVHAELLESGYQPPR
jgi:L-ribulose-5-phosphate 3-epimerase